MTLTNCFSLIATIALLMGLTGLTGCTPQFAQQMFEAAVVGVTQGTVLGLTDNPELADQAGQEMQESLNRQRQAAIKKELLAALPTKWRHDGSDLYQDDSGNWIYAHPDQQTWYKWIGSAWIDPDANNQLVASTAPAPRQKPALASTPISSGEEGPATIADARKAKKDQGLQGRMFRNSSTKAWFLEDQEGATYKLKNGAFVKI